MCYEAPKIEIIGFASTDMCCTLEASGPENGQAPGIDVPGNWD